MTFGEMGLVPPAPWGPRASHANTPSLLLQINILHAFQRCYERKGRLRLMPCRKRVLWNKGSREGALWGWRAAGPVSTPAGGLQLGRLPGNLFFPRCQLLSRPCGPGNPLISLSLTQGSGKPRPKGQCPLVPRPWFLSGLLFGGPRSKKDRLGSEERAALGARLQFLCVSCQAPL